MEEATRVMINKSVIVSEKIRNNQRVLSEFIKDLLESVASHERHWSNIYLFWLLYTETLRLFYLGAQTWKRKAQDNISNIFSVYYTNSLVLAVNRISGAFVHSVGVAMELIYRPMIDFHVLDAIIAYI